MLHRQVEGQTIFGQPPTTVCCPPTAHFSAKHHQLVASLKTKVVAFFLASFLSSFSSFPSYATSKGPLNGWDH